jgi:radical SAM superfamily enzyme YgiQ (UPF0313 family)
MKKVLLINLPHTCGDLARPPSDIPLGICYIAGALTHAGHAVKVLDLWVNGLDQSLIISEVTTFHPEIIGISAMSTQYNALIRLLVMLRPITNSVIVLGGPMATHSAHVVLRRPEPEFAILGEGEETMLDLLERIDTPEKVAGIAYKYRGEVKFTPKRRHISDLDAIPIPSRDDFELESYMKNGSFSSLGLSRTLNVISGRGCPFSCSFCSKGFNGFRMRSVANVMTEIQMLKDKYRADSITFNDELVVATKKRILEICDGMAEVGLPWGCQARVDVFDSEIAKAMKKAGAMYVGLGIESGCQMILDNMNKKTTLAQCEKAIAAAAQVQLNPTIQMMFGYVGESDATLAKTIDFMNRNDVLNYVDGHRYSFFMTTPLPGSPLYETVLTEGSVRDEEEYLEKLDWGYNGDRLPLVNLTTFKDKEVLFKKDQLETRLWRSYLLRHPLFMAEHVLSILKKDGASRLLRKVDRFIRGKV